MTKSPTQDNSYSPVTSFFLQAATDLATACKIDFDEQADEWLKEVQPNAKKLAEHQRKKDRRDAEKALNEKKERIRKAKEAREAAAKEAAENPQVKPYKGGVDLMLKCTYCR